MNSRNMSTATFGPSRHPFRSALPLRVLRRLPQYEPEVQARMAAMESREAELPEPVVSADEPDKRRFITMQDVKDFLIAYVACFMAVSAWLS